MVTPFPFASEGETLSDGTAVAPKGTLSDGTAVACGRNDDGQCEVPTLVGGLTYIPHLLVTLLLQATLDNGSVVFVTLGGVERCRIQASPGAPLADVYDWLTAEHSAGRLGPGFDRVDGVL